jgi:hypothetical protein
MDFFRHLGKWLAAVFRAWYGWVGASATAGMVGFGQGMKWWESPGKPVYIGLLIVGLAISMFQAWRGEHLDSEVAKKKIDDMASGPQLTGYGFQLKYFPRTGIVTPQFHQSVLDQYAQDRGEPKTVYTCECDVFLELYITNKAPGKGSIREFCLTVNEKELEFI